jgi:putative hydrolase of HD superfamily
VEAASISEHDEIAAFGFEVGHLARSPRSGWLLAGVRDPESVAEHSHRAAVLAYIIATVEGADPKRACTLAVFHDLPETRTTDLHSVAKRNVTAVDPQQIIKDQTAGLPPAVADAICAVIAEVETVSTVESACAKDADKLDCLLRAREYQAEGYTQLTPWVDSMAAAMRTDTGKILARRAQQVAPSVWWDEVVSSYGRP